MEIKGNMVTLRAIESEDLEFMREMLNSPEIEHLVVGWTFPISKYQQRLWYEKSINDINNLRLVIDTPEGGAVGLVALTEIDWKNSSATCGIKIGLKANRSKGIGTDAVMAIMRYAFDELQLNRLEAAILEDNVKSQQQIKRCGWIVEGMKRSSIFKNGKFRDLIMFGILKEEYDDMIRETRYWDND